MELEEGDRESAITSLTDSFEEEDEQEDHAQLSTRPRLTYVLCYINACSYTYSSSLLYTLYPSSVLYLSLP